MNSMLEALSKAGFNIDNAFVEYDKFSDVKLPFGSCVNHRDGDIVYESCKKSLSGINYIRKTAEVVTIDDLKMMCPSAGTSDEKYKEFLISNIDKVRFINKGKYHYDENKVRYGVNTKYDYEDIVEDTPYGFSDVVFYFRFNHQTMKVELVLDIGMINSHYQNKYREMIKSKYGLSYTSDATDEDKFNIVKDLCVDAEFIPFYVSDFDGVTISNFKHVDKFGCFVDEYISPCLGSNIKLHRNIMSKLSDWIRDGGFIKNDVFYIILESKGNKEKLYLRRYESGVQE